MVQWLQPILQNLGFQVFNSPTTIYEDIQPNIEVIRENRLTIQVKHIAAPIHYVHEKYALLTIYTNKFKTTIQPADIGNKISTYPLLERHYS